jgi:hypothetical protein
MLQGRDAIGMRPSAHLAVKLAAASGVIAVAALATSCTSGGTATPSKTVTVTVTSQASPTPATPSVPSGLAQCDVADLKLAVGSSQGAAGTIYYQLNFTNIASSACTMYGYPGVSFVGDRHGRPIGAPASRSLHGALELVTLAPGAVAHVTLAVSNVLTSTSCRHPVTVNWLQVYPPDQFTAIFVPLSRQGCADKTLVFMHVSQVTLGT